MDSPKKSRHFSSYDYSILTKLKCQIHSKQVSLICTSINCTKDRFLCDECLSIHLTSNDLNEDHLVKNLEYLQNLMKLNDDKIIIKRNFADDYYMKFAKYNMDIKDTIVKDFQRIQYDLSLIQENLQKALDNMKNKIDQSTKEIGILVRKIKDIPLFSERLIYYFEEKEDQISNFREMVKELIYFKGHEEDYYIYNEIKNFEKQIKVKVEDHPKYIFHQNGDEVLKKLFEKLKDLKFLAKNIDNALLMKDSNLNLLLNSKGKNVNDFSLSLGKYNNHIISKKNQFKPISMVFLSQIKSLHTKGITCMAPFGSDHIVSGSNEGILYFTNLRTFNESEIKGISMMGSIPTSMITINDDRNNFKLFIIGFHKGMICIFSFDNLSAPKDIFWEHQSKISGLLALKNNEILISVSLEGLISAYNLHLAKKLKSVKEPESINCIEAHDFDSFLTGSEDCMVKLWRLDEKFNLIEVMKIVNEDSLNFIRFYQTNKNIIITNQYDKINIWNIKTGELKKQFKAHNGNILQAYLFECNNKTRWSYDIINQIEQKSISMKIHSMDKTREKKKELNIPHFDELFDGRVYLLTVGEDQKLRLWNLWKQKTKKIYETNIFSGEINLKDALINFIFLTNEKDDLIYFLNSIDSDNKFNLWKINKKI